MQKFNKKIIGEDWLTQEKVIKEQTTKNTITQTIRVKKTRAIALNCGHLIPVTKFPNGTPKNYTYCEQCENKTNINSGAIGEI